MRSATVPNPSPPSSTAASLDDWTAGGFGIYVHWPFCAAKCPYCDFNSHVTQYVDHSTWAEAFREEVTRAAALLQPRLVRSVFFGGGTPSLMAPETVAAVLDQIAHQFPLANDVEVTLEANPTSVEGARFSAFRTAGVTRVSMGVQALNDVDLRRLGRQHDVAEAQAAFDVARSTFDRVSFDLIYARQDQTVSDWERELRQALDMAIDHLSLYQLTIEPGTVFGARHAVGKLSGLPSDDLGADMYELTQEICAAHGMPAYEVSNHARDMAQSQHNLIYWRSGDYLGIGPGAHGRLTIDGVRYATEQPRMPGAWLSAKDRTTWAALAQEEHAQEMALMGLRLREGIDLGRLERIRGTPVSTTALDELIELGMLERLGDRLCATQSGTMVLNAVLDRLMNA